uniref:Ubiquitin-like protease family profile domain-containing protein n=1 Tax=Tanacetum cinerariifolium TaxID=118510 RepID=A0A699GMG0_TANCI|nr:hypothetical protein [Tanacetum cinerariifolium]
MANPPKIFDAKVSLRSKMHLLSKIEGNLQPYKERELVFKNSVFGRVCLLVVEEVVLMGRKEFLNVPLRILTLVEDLCAWDAYPWVEYMWQYFYERTLNVVPKHVEMHIKCKKDSGKEMATYNLNNFVWASKPLIPILELTPTNEELKETWLIRSLSYIRGEDASFIQAIKPGQNVNEAPIVNEQSIEIDGQAGAVDDHDPAAPINSNNLLDDVDSLFKEVIDVRPDLVGRVDELKTKLVQTLTSNNESNGEPLNCYYQESQQSSLENLVKALESELEPNVSCLQADNLDEAWFDDAVKDNDEIEHAMDVDNEDGKEPSKLFKLAWDPYGIVVDDQFWLAFVGLEEKKRVVHRQCPHFCPTIIGGGMPIYISKAKGRCVLWTDVDKVYFPLNEPELHWALAELHLRTSVIIIYDSMTPRKRNKNAPIVENINWWIDMRETMSKQLPWFLDKIEVLKRKGLQLEEYKITFQFEEKSHVKVALAYRERMLAYYWKYKVSYQLPEYESS